MTLSILLLSGPILPAQAEDLPTRATLLHLSATGSVQSTPDQLTAELVAQATSSLAAEAQRRVNLLMETGMKMAGDTSKVEAKAVGYSVVPSDEKRSGWTAQQSLELAGTDGQDLLKLVGKLQEQGFATASLSWQLSPPRQRKAHDQATSLALKDLQSQAGSVAATLGLRVDHIQDIRVDAVMAAPRMRAMAKFTQMEAPQATNTSEDVSASVSADIVLLR